MSATNPQFLRDPFPGNVIPAEPDQPGRDATSPASIRCRTPPATSTTTRRPSTATPPTTCSPAASIIRCRRRTRSSGGSTGAGSSSMRRRARPRAASRRRPKPRRGSISGRSWPGIQNTRLTTHGAAFNYSRIVSPNLVNELRIGYARTQPFTFQSDFGINAADSLGIRGINVTEFTTGLPNINIPDLTGISGGPAFLPVNPKQFHWQIEDSLVWLQGPAPAEVRLPAGRSLSVAVHQHRHARHHQLRPQLHQQSGHQHRRLRHRVAAHRLHQQRRARLPARALHAADAGARPVRAGRLQAAARGSRSTPAFATRSSGPRPKRTTRSSTTTRPACG